ncbi:hypothetical protein [Salinibacterium sp. ZJ450]|uniref:hypothetical protein n=1 Tax=Salinibacterium sp. ZJ450 TaxID=2708338 RepID=UPI001423E977|nr:hypothetical protein [Salinibacterium sp. ZJ450]
MGCHKHVTHHHDCYACRQAELHEGTRSAIQTQTEEFQTALAESKAQTAAAYEILEQAADEAADDREALLNIIEQQKEETATLRWIISADGKAWESFQNRFDPIASTASEIEERWDTAWKSLVPDPLIEARRVVRLSQTAPTPITTTPDERREAAEAAAKDLFKRKRGGKDDVSGNFAMTSLIVSILVLSAAFVYEAFSHAWRLDVLHVPSEMNITTLLWASIPFLVPIVAYWARARIDSRSRLAEYNRVLVRLNTEAEKNAKACHDSEHALAEAYRDAEAFVDSTSTRFGLEPVPISPKDSYGPFVRDNPLRTVVIPSIWTDAAARNLATARDCLQNGPERRVLRGDLPNAEAPTKRPLSDAWPAEIRDVWHNAEPDRHDPSTLTQTQAR